MFATCGATASGLSSQLIVEHLGYLAAFSACGIIGTAAAVLLWLGLPPAKPSPVGRLEATEYGLVHRRDAVGL